MLHTKMRFKFIQKKDPEYTKERMLRWEVLSKPQGMPPESVYTPEEEASLHFVAIEGKSVVGCVLFYPETPEGGRVHQMAISEEYRGKGFGRQLLTTLEHELVKRGVKEVHLFARQDTLGFYEQMGYHLRGNPLEIGGISQQLMQKNLEDAHER